MLRYGFSHISFSTSHAPHRRTGNQRRVRDRKKKKRCAERTTERRREKTGGTVWSVSSSRYGEGVMGQPGRTAAQPHFLCLPPLLVSVILTGLLATSFFFLKSYGGWGNASQRWPVAKNDYLRVICAKASCRLAFQRGVGYTRRKVIHHY